MTEADLAPPAAEEASLRRGASLSGGLKRQERRMIDAARDIELGQRTARTRTGAAMRRDPRGAAGLRADPLRHRAGRRAGARSQAQVARPRRLGDGDARRAWPRRSSARRSPAASSAKYRLPPDLADRTERLLERARARRAGASPARPVWCRPASPRRRRRWSTRGSPACCTPRRPRPTGSASSTRHAPPALRQGRRPSGRPVFDHRRNWIWHWAAQM